MKEVTSVKMANSDTTFTHKFRKIMKKFIFIVDFVEIIVRLLRGESIEGRLYFDKGKKRLTFQPWYRKTPRNSTQKKICDLDGGYLAETDKHIVRHEKFPISLGVKGIMGLLRRDQEQTVDALTDRELIDFV